MTYVITLSVSILLVGIFLFLLRVEKKRNGRFFAHMRDILDAHVARASFIFTNVDWGEFAGHITRTSIEHAVHELAHRTLLLVRSLERLLTGVVRTLRARREGVLLPKTDTNSRIARVTGFVRETFHRTRHEKDENNSIVEEESSRL